MSFRSVRAGAAAVLLALVVAACGAGPSASSPANKVPAGAALYASATVQPSSAQTHALEQFVDTIAGKGTAEKLLTKLRSALAKPSSNGLSFSNDVEPWLGEHVGVALTGIPATGMTNQQALLEHLLVVAPTSHPDAARTALPKLLKGMPKGITAEVSGNYVLLGGENAVRAAAMTSSGTSLASTAAYRSDVAKVGQSSLLLLYVNAHAVAQAGLSALSGNTALKQALTPMLQQVPEGANAMLGASVTSKTIELNIATGGEKSQAPSGAPAAVSNLPADTWLAVGTPAISSKQLLGAVSQIGALAKLAGSGALMPKSSSSGTARLSVSSAGTVATTAKSKTKASTKTTTKAKTKTTTKSNSNANGNTGTAPNTQNPMLTLQKLLPLVKSGLGPMQLSVAGFPNNGLQAGLRLSEPDPATASDAVQALYALANVANANVSGSGSGFSVTVSPTITVDVGSVASNVVATVGYPQATAFTNPSLTLAAGNTVYQQAISQLPMGSNVPLFVDLEKLSSLVSQDAKLKTTSFAKALTHLSYLIVGHSSASDTTRIVLGLR